MVTGLLSPLFSYFYFLIVIFKKTLVLLSLHFYNAFYKILTNLIYDEKNCVTTSQEDLAMLPMVLAVNCYNNDKLCVD